MENNIEVRNNGHECRAIDEAGKRFIEGYAIVYDHPSKLIFERGDVFFETIQRGALDKVLANPKLDVIITPNHTYSQVIARTLSGTLVLTNDNKGLKYRAEVPNISFANDIYESIKRGDTFESSFTFMVDAKGQTWSKDGEGNNLRTITDIMILKEVSPVTWGAYSDTQVAARSLDSASVSKHESGESEKLKSDVTPPAMEQPQSNLDLFKKKLHILKIK